MRTMITEEYFDIRFSGRKATLGNRDDRWLDRKRDGGGYSGQRYFELSARDS